jgi:hypothetical protein
VLYIDLSTFFPRLDRTAVRMCEMTVGLPEEVADLALRIYGRGRDADDNVRCRFDSGGLSG